MEIDNLISGETEWILGAEEPVIVGSAEEAALQRFPLPSSFRGSTAQRTHPRTRQRGDMPDGSQELRRSAMQRHAASSLHGNKVVWITIPNLPPTVVWLSRAVRIDGIFKLPSASASSGPKYFPMDLERVAFSIAGRKLEGLNRSGGERKVHLTEPVLRRALGRQVARQRASAASGVIP